ncbi:MAG: hypothetical protein V3R99_11790 [Thermoguttaceae bacterium]
MGLVIGFAVSSEALAQDYRRGYGRPGGEGFRSGPPGGGPSRGPSDGGPSRGPSGGESSRGPSSSSQSSADRYAGFLQGLDTNHDGRIDEKEAEGRRRYFVEMMARRAGIEAKFPISVDKLRKGLEAQGSSSGSPWGGSSRGNDDKKDEKKSESDAEERLVPGFGVDAESTVAEVPKFGIRIENSSYVATRLASSRSPSGSGSKSSSAKGADEKIQRWAEGLIRQYDRNKNGKIDREEMGAVKDEYKKADRNRDGVITREEMTAGLVEYSRKRAASSGSSSDGKAGFTSGANRWADRNSYRFLSPLERLPEGLPDWFLSSDANADGQITLAEYATDWSTPQVATANVAEFGRFDLNRDGIITPKECIAAEEAGDLAVAAAGMSGSPTAMPSRTMPSRPATPRPPTQSTPTKTWTGW